MCLAIYKPAGKLIPRDHLFNGFQSNKDGAGMSFNENGQLVVRKGYFDFESFYTEYLKNEDRQMLIHFRWATHGHKNEFNCHPWLIQDKDYSVSVIHNGVISIESTDEMSDTGHFVHGWLAPLIKRHSRKLAFDPVFKKIIEEFVGSYNKVAILDSYGRFTIYNENQGAWDGGVWYSNTNYKQAPWFTRAGCGGGWCGDDDDYSHWAHRGGGHYVKTYADGRPASQTQLTLGPRTPDSDAIEKRLDAMDEADLVKSAELRQERLLAEEEEDVDRQVREEMYEEWLEELEEADPSTYQVALKEVEQHEAAGMDRIEAIRLVLG